ncbi:hypothetical protein ACIBCT_35345 [Streptosporangium sp. NPDC050855]|uniref:hypothetical protein n=1 Tax=Streptosporangium sp. NPDC050855 TaxID=3366194 RepID=UPI0037B64896
MPKILIATDKAPQSSVPNVRGMNWVARRAAIIRAAFHLERQERAVRALMAMTFDGDERIKLKALLQQIQADIRSIHVYAKAGYPSVREI